MSSHPHRNKLLSDVPDEVWAAAREREKVIRHLVQEPPAYCATGEAMAAATEQDLTPNHLYRLLKPYETDPRTRSLLPKDPGPIGGRHRLDPPRRGSRPFPNYRRAAVIFKLCAC